jgi:hypothetical protein
MPVDELHFFEIEYDPMPTALSDLCLQCLHMFRFDSTAEPENRISSIRLVLDLELARGQSRGTQKRRVASSFSVVKSPTPEALFDTSSPSHALGQFWAW